MALLLLACIALICAAAPASASVPSGNTDYDGFDGKPGKINTATSDGGFLDWVAALHTSPNSRRLTAAGDGSSVNFGISCKGGSVTGTLRLAGARIKRDGSFALRKRTGRTRFRLQGRFTSPNTATFVYRVTAVRRHRRCKGARTNVALFRDGEPPFSDCRGQKATTLIEGPAARLFLQYKLTPQGFMPYVFACLDAIGDRVTLGQDYDDERVELPRLAEPYTAWVAGGCAAGPCTGSIHVVALDGSLTRRVLPDPPVQSYYSTFTDLELKSNGSFAWIVNHYDAASKLLLTEVRAFDAGGMRTLDSGTDIAPTSLTLDASALSWEKGGVPQSATLD